MRATAVAIFLLFTASLVNAQPVKPSQTTKPDVTMERYEGTSIVTELSRNIKLNERSSLKREWFVVRDEGAPAFIEGAAGIIVDFKSDKYQYIVLYKIKAKEPITAFEARVHVLNVFGQLLHTLSATELVDLSPGTKEFVGTWRIWFENEASEAFASVTYVAQVRTASGRVYEAERAAVFDQIRKVAKRITAADLEPKRETPTK